MMKKKLKRAGELKPTTGKSYDINSKFVARARIFERHTFIQIKRVLIINKAAWN